jgi:DNA-binding transcriptional LysR family regulator
VTAIDPARAVELVEAGALDVALTPRARQSSTVKQRVLFALDLWVAMRRDHPLTRGTLTRRALARYPRLAVSFDGSPPTAGAVGIKPALSVSAFLAAPDVLAECDAWAVLPGPFARKLVNKGAIGARPMPPPLPKPKLALRMVWPEAQDASPASRWLRALIVEAAGAIAQTG